MISLFSKKPEGIVGIDIGTASVKAIELVRKGTRVRLQNYGMWGDTQYQSSYRAGNAALVSLRESDVTELLTAVISEAKTVSRTVAFSIPLSSSFFTVIDLPKMDAEEVKRAIPYEARQYIPIPVSEVVLSWHPISETAGSGGEQKINILLVAVPREVIERYKRIAASCNLSLSFLEVENLSTIRALSIPDSDTTLLIDIGAHATGITIMDQGYVRVTHHLNMGGENFTQAIARGINVDIGKAEYLKRSIGILGKGGDEEVSSIIFPILDIIYEEVARLVALHNQRYPTCTIRTCMLTGGGANLPGLVDYFVEKLAISVSIGAPFGGIMFPDVLGGVLSEVGPSLAVAAGLAKKLLSEKRHNRMTQQHG